MRNQKGNVGLIALVVVGMFILITFFLGFRSTAPGTIKVVTRMGQVTGRVLQPGASWITPLIESTETYNTRKVIYEATTEEKQRGSNADYKDFPVDTNTVDGQRVDIYYTVRFSVDPSKATWVLQNLGGEEALVEKIVKTESRIWARNLPRDFTAEDLYSGKGTDKVQVDLAEKLRPTFEKNGILLDTVGIREVVFTEDYVKAVEAKQIQAVKVETEKNIAEQAKFQKEARITQAEGQAKEQELQRQTISPELLQKMLIERWDGHYPQYLITGGTNGQFILPLPNK